MADVRTREKSELIHFVLYDKTGAGTANAIFNSGEKKLSAEKNPSAKKNMLN